VSKTIEAMLAGNFAESKGEINFPEISTNILEKVIQYLYYKVRSLEDQSLDPWLS
jgi:transcription elongation factor B subunit 1